VDEISRTLELWGKGLSMSQIALRLGICPRTVCGRLKKEGKGGRRIDGGEIYSPNGARNSSRGRH